MAIKTKNNCKHYRKCLNSFAADFTVGTVLNNFATDCRQLRHKLVQSNEANSLIQDRSVQKHFGKLAHLTEITTKITNLLLCFKRHWFYRTMANAICADALRNTAWWIFRQVYRPNFLVTLLPQKWSLNLYAPSHPLNLNSFCIINWFDSIQSSIMYGLRWKVIQVHESNLRTLGHMLPDLLILISNDKIMAAFTIPTQQQIQPVRLCSTSSSITSRLGSNSSNGLNQSN